MFRVCHAFLSVHCSFVVTCWERANILALLCVMFYCVFVTFGCGVLGQLWYLIILNSDLCLLTYFLCIWKKFNYCTNCMVTQCTSDIDNSVAKRSDTGKTVVYCRTRHLAGKLFLYFIHWIPWIWMPGFNSELYFDRRRHPPTNSFLYCIYHFIWLLGGTWHTGDFSRCISVWYGQNRTVDTEKSVVLAHFYETGLRQTLHL